MSHFVGRSTFSTTSTKGEYLPVAVLSGAPCYLTKFRDSCHLNSFTYAANGRCPERPASVTTTHKSRFVITPSNGWTAIRNAILASLARYRALRLSELPCRLSLNKDTRAVLDYLKITKNTSISCAAECLKIEPIRPGFIKDLVDLVYLLTAPLKFLHYQGYQL